MSNETTLQRIARNDISLRTGKVKGAFEGIFPRIECANGASLSVQGGHGFYSNPSEMGSDSYTHVEVGFPDPRPPKNWNFYGGADGVYSNVPLSLVERYIESHGGERES